MGGNLLAKWGLPPKRIQAAEYKALTAEVKTKIIENLVLTGSTAKIELIRSYRNKESFGDADFVMTEITVPQLKPIVQRVSASPHYHTNDGTISFPYNGFQVDLITQPADSYESSLNYFAYNDLGNLLGRIYHKLGVSFGHRGLVYTIRESHFTGNPDDNHVAGTTILSTGISQILKCAGYDPITYHAGFDTVEQIFEYVTTSPFFDASIFEYESLNHTNRTRNRKRANYAGFLEWLSTSAHKERRFPFLKKEEYRDFWNSQFPFLSDELLKLEKEHGRKLLLRSCLNGDHVKVIVGEDGYKIGWILTYIRQNYSEQEILGLTEETRTALVRKTALYYGI